MVKPPERLTLPDARQSAGLIVALMANRGEEQRNITRARLAQSTIRKLTGRGQLSIEFLSEVQSYLLAAGWCLFCAGPSHYGIIKVSAVLGWPQISSKRLSKELNQVRRGLFDFASIEKSLLTDVASEEVDE